MQPLCLTSHGCKKGNAVVEPRAELRQSTLTCIVYSRTSIKIPRDSRASKT